MDRHPGTPFGLLARPRAEDEPVIPRVSRRVFAGLSDLSFGGRARLAARERHAGGLDEP